MDDARGARREAAEAIGRGFASVKLKVGRAGREEDVARVRAVRSALGPDVRLRLDANGAWSAKEAIGVIDRVRGCNIEFVEQPVAPGNIDAMRRRRDSPPSLGNKLIGNALLAATHASGDLRLRPLDHGRGPRYPFPAAQEREGARVDDVPPAGGPDRDRETRVPSAGEAAGCGTYTNPSSVPVPPDLPEPPPQPARSTHTAYANSRVQIVSFTSLLLSVGMNDRPVPGSGAEYIKVIADRSIAVKP